MNIPKYNWVPNIHSIITNTEQINMKNLYEITGNINHINDLIIQRLDYQKLQNELDTLREFIKKSSESKIPDGYELVKIDKEPVGIIMGFTDEGEAIVDFACEPISEIEIGTILFL